MDVLVILQDLVFDYTLRTVALGSAVLGIVSGCLGSYAVLRKQSLLGDAISHAALPGIALAFLLTGIKSTPILLMGAALAGWFATLTILAITRNTRIKEDSALGMVLSVYFGIGLVLLTFIQKKPDATQAGLETFLFGQAATLLQEDVLTMSIMGLLAILAVSLLWKEFKLLSFDSDFGATLGFPVRLLNIILVTLIVIAIVLGLQTVGVVLMSAMVVAPAAAARQWTNQLGRMIVLAGLFGAVSGVCGAVLSSLIPRLPTGPTIVICITAIVVFSLLFAPARGLIWHRIHGRRRKRDIQIQALLLDLYELSKQHETLQHGHTLAVLRTMRAGENSVKRNLRYLESKKWVQQIAPDKWAITETGLEEVNRILKEEKTL